MQKKWSFWFVIGAVAIVSAFYPLWYWQATSIKQTVMNQLSSAENLGFRISYDKIEPAGFPFSLGVSISNLIITQNTGVPFTSKIEGVVEIKHSLFTQNQNCEIKGVHLLTIQPAPSRKNIEIRHKGSASLEGAVAGVPTNFSLNLREVEVNGIPVPWKTDKLAIHFQAAPNWYLLLPTPDFKASFKIDLEKLTLKGLSLTDGVPEVLDKFLLEGSYQGPALTTTLSANFIDKWYKSSGVIDIKTLKVQWGKFSSSLNATLVLDSALQPAISGTLKLNGVEDMIEHLSDKKILDSVQVSQAKGVIGFMKVMLSPQKTSKENRKDEFSLPITFQEGVLSVGGQEIIKTSKIEWSKP